MTGLAERILEAPTAQHFGVLPFLIYLMMALHLPFVSMLMVSSALSVAHRKTRPELARIFIRLVTANHAVWVVFGVLPLLCLILLMGQYLHGAAMPVTRYLETVFLLSVVAQALLIAYRRSMHVGAGALGHLLLVVAYFFFTSVMDLAGQPERWTLIESPMPLLFSIQVVVHFGLFSVIAILLTGTGILFFCFRWQERQLPGDAPHRSVLRTWGLGLAIGGAAALPPHLLWDFHTMPTYAQGPQVFVAAVTAVVTAAVVCVLALRMWSRKHERHGTPVFLLALAVFLALQFKTQALQANANQEHLVLLHQRALAKRSRLATEQQKLYARVEADPRLGAEVFNQRCSACHAWDRKVVGPPYLSVIPKYAGKEEDLQAFVRNPTKIDPAYPVMPDQGLREVEVLSVVRFLLEEGRKRMLESKP